MKARVSVVLFMAAIMFGSYGTRASGQELGDPGFEALSGKAVSREAAAGQWSIPPGEPYADSIEVKAGPSAARGGKAGLSLRQLNASRLAAVHQPIPQLAAGIYEFKLWAKGKGVLALKTDTLRRRGDLTKEWVAYSVTFEQAKAGPADLAILVSGHAQVDDASLAPASAEKRAAWKEREKAQAEYGFVPEHFAAQSPQPGAPVEPTGAFQGGPVTWRKKVVFYDRRYDNIHIVHPEAVARYLGANGFRVLEAAPFGEWMRKAIREGAYGTVCVMTHGLCPGSVYDDKVKDSPIRKYLEAGGRVVWIGDVPFYYMQDDVHPQVYGKTGTGEMLGVRDRQACWYGKGNPKVLDLGKAWGLADAGGATFGAYPEDITAALSSFYSAHAASEVAVYWLKNLNPLFPWSGFIRGHRGNDMAKPMFQESVYRLALYAGKPVDAPSGTAVPTEAAAPSLIKVVLDPPRRRQCYYRGEKIPVHLERGTGVVQGALRLSLVRNGQSFPAGQCPPPTKETPAVAKIPTAHLACGDYQFQVRATVGGKEIVAYERTVSLCPRREDPPFFYGVWPGNPGNPYRQKMMLEDLASAALNIGVATTHMPPGILDLAIKYDLRFGMRAHGPVPRGSSSPEWAEALQRAPNGETIPHWGGARPTLGLLHPKRRRLDAQDVARQLKELSKWPNSWRRCETCDDFSTDYGWDYSDLAKRMFKKKTGLEAPVPPELVRLKARFKGCGLIDRPKGVVPDRDSWLQWSTFATKDIVGGYNRALTEACVKAVPDLRIGPVPGGMHVPPWASGQYPPHSFGTEGFNRLSYYYYLNYWQPLVTNLYCDEMLRMNNRGLELATLADCMRNEPTYNRNTFFLHLAGGCQAIDYFAYTAAQPEAWKELGRLGNTVVRPLYPFLGKPRPVQTDIGLLLPYTEFAHTWLYPTHALYAYANLLGAHLDIQPTCEEEALSGYIRNYKVLLLWHVQWMRESVVKALEEYIAKGGVVLADSTTIVPIKGAIKLPVDLAMGDKRSKPDVNDPRFGYPGIKDYLHPDRVADIGKAIAPYAQPWAECTDLTLVVRRHAYRGVTYLWLVNVHSQEEYEYIRARTHGLSEPLELANPEKAKREWHQYLAARAGKRFTPRVSIPAGPWAAYDVLKGRRVQLAKEGKRLTFTADMERLGGTLIALYPEPVERVACGIAARVKRGQKEALHVTVSGPSGKPLTGTPPLAVTVLTPQGEWPEVTGAHATEDGVWSTRIYPAVNDPAGTWRVRARELSSGVVGEAAFEVE